MPPRLATALIRLALRREPWADTTLGDLREEFADLTRRRGRWPAARWYWREALRLCLPTGSSLPGEPPRPKDSIMRTLLHETRLAARALVRQPTVSLAIVFTLAIGLGLNAATFGMADALLLRPFTIPTVDRLVVLSELSANDPYLQESVAPGNYLDLRQHLGGAITRMGTVGWGDVNMSGGDQPERVAGSFVGTDYFTMLGQVPADGRFFLSGEDAEAAPRTVVISDALWHRRFGAAPDIIGRTMLLDGQPHTIIGRTSPGFDYPNGSDLWMPQVLEAEDREARAAKYLTVIGELAPGATVAQAQAEMTAAYERLKREFPEANQRYTLTVNPFAKAMIDFGLPTVLGLWQVAALLLMLIAGTNVANLFLARGAEREREIAVRLAIGASRWRLIRQLLVESLLLALVAVPLALLVSAAAIAIIRNLMPAELLRFIPGWTAMGVNLRVAVATGLFATVCAILFGLLPALRASRPNLTVSLKDGGRSGAGAVGRSRLRRGLVVAEITLALPLLICAGLAAIGAQRLASGPQGYDPEGLSRVRMSLPVAAYDDAADRRTVTQRLLDRAAGLPAITEVATTSAAPATPGGQRRQVVVDGRAPDPDGVAWINYRAVSDRFHHVLRIPLREGRAFSPQDRDGTEPVAIVSESLARLYWPDGSAVGRRVKLSPTATEWITVVGVSGNTIDDWFSARNAPTIYVPVDQWPSTEIHLFARGRATDAAHVDALRAAVRDVDPTLPVFDVGTMLEAIHTRTTGLRFIAQFMAAFGMISLVLASAGIYSVMAHYVAQRRHEIGLRLALGATAQGVLRLTLGQGLRMAALGIALGTAAGLALARLMESALFGAVAFEPMLFVAGPVVLALVAALATLLPAQAAMRVDPARVLRE